MQMSSEEVQDDFEERLHRVKHNLTELNEKIKTKVIQNPVACLAGALAVGFIIGKLVSRR